MADERPNVVVQYVTKTDTTPPPSAGENIISVIVLLAGLALAFGWWK